MWSKVPSGSTLEKIQRFCHSTFQSLDAYTNNYDYLGQRATKGTGGTYLVAGPEWNGQVPEGMTVIWTPTNLAWLVNRILVKGPADVPNVNAIQDKIIVKPLSVFQGNINTSSQPLTTLANFCILFILTDRMIFY